MKNEKCLTLLCKFVSSELIAWKEGYLNYERNQDMFYLNLAIVP